MGARRHGGGGDSRTDVTGAPGGNPAPLRTSWRRDPFSRRHCAARESLRQCCAEYVRKGARQRGYGRGRLFEARRAGNRFRGFCARPTAAPVRHGRRHTASALQSHAGARDAVCEGGGAHSGRTLPRVVDADAERQSAEDRAAVALKDMRGHLEELTGECAEQEVRAEVAEARAEAAEAALDTARADLVHASQSASSRIPELEREAASFQGRLMSAEAAAERVAAEDARAAVERARQWEREAGEEARGEALSRADALAQALDEERRARAAAEARAESITYPMASRYS